jgi:DNA-binding HxlR family transcriptional regulator
MSPALLASRLRELEAAGIIALTEAGASLDEVVGAFAKWGQTWLDEQTALYNASIDHLM